MSRSEPITHGAVALSPSEVAAIVAVNHRIIRNLQITEGYARLAAAMRERTDGAADWCTFATWASRQAGSTIRGEDLIDRWRRRLGRKGRLLEPFQTFNRWLLRQGVFQPDSRWGRVVAEIHTPFDVFERTSAAVAEGNVKVFEEVGDVFARFLASVPPDAAADSPAFMAFASSLRTGPAPDGQDQVRDAFTLYQRQRFEPDPTARASLTLLANLLIGVHEQTRLQPQIAAAMDAPLVTAADLGERLLTALIPSSRRWPEVVRRPAVSVVGWLATALERAAIRVSRELVTEVMMVLTLPNAALALGRNLDAPTPAVFSGALHPELERFVRQYDLCTPERSDCGADDWTDLTQRMHYIFHVFRAYASESALFDPPFTTAQVERFRGGHIPEGNL
jgi:hypothetical protein